MAITKETEIFQIDSNPTSGAISVRVDTIVKEDSVEISSKENFPENILILDT